jgi:hypothetical protein
MDAKRSDIDPKAAATARNNTRIAPSAASGKV